MEAVYFSEMLVPTYKSTRRHKPQDQVDFLTCYTHKRVWDSRLHI